MHVETREPQHLAHWGCGVDWYCSMGSCRSKAKRTSLTRGELEYCAMVTRQEQQRFCNHTLEKILVWLVQQLRNDRGNRDQDRLWALQDSTHNQQLNRCALVCFHWHNALTSNDGFDSAPARVVTIRSPTDASLGKYWWKAVRVVDGSDETCDLTIRTLAIKLSGHLRALDLSRPCTCDRTSHCQCAAGPPSVSSAALLWVAGMCPNLTKLSLARMVDGDTLIDQGLMALADGCPNLVSLNLHMCLYSRDALLHVIDRCKHIETINLASGFDTLDEEIKEKVVKFDDDLMASLAACCPSLRGLSVSALGLTRKSIDAFVANPALCPRLNYLDLVDLSYAKVLPGLLGAFNDLRAQRPWIVFNASADAHALKRQSSEPEDHWPYHCGGSYWPDFPPGWNKYMHQLNQ